MWPNPQFSADLVTFAEEILNGKRHFFVFTYELQFLGEFHLQRISRYLSGLHSDRIKW